MEGQLYAVVSPSGDTVVERAELSPRLGSMDGMTVGLVWNRVFRGDETLPIIGEQLQRRFEDVRVIPWGDFPVTSVQALHAGTQQETLQAFSEALLDKRVDAIIAGNGG